VGCVAAPVESVAAVLSGVGAGAAAGAPLLSPDGGVAGVLSAGGATAAGGATVAGGAVSSARATDQDAGAMRQQAIVKLVKTRCNRIMILDSKTGNVVVNNGWNPKYIRWPDLMI
jgi:hypothetical protein